MSAADGAGAPGPAPERIRVHETLRGPGRVFDGGRLLAEVTYALHEVEEVLDAAGAGGAGQERRPLAGRHIYGRLLAEAPGLFDTHVGGPLTLRLADDRRLMFTVAKVLNPRDILVQGLAALQ